jgi:RimJ/RimL family protein N-acetyltransferase
VVALREWALSDAPAVAAACRDVEIVRWTTQIPEDYTEEHAREWIESTAKGWDRGSAELAVVDRATGSVAGAIRLVAHTPWVGEVGYWAVPSFRCAGRMTRAVRLVSGWRHHLGLVRLQLCTLVRNQASERVAEKSGFAREGRLRRYANQRGELRDVTMWARLAGDAWEAGGRDRGD